MINVFRCPRPVIVTDSQEEIDEACDKHIAVIGYEHDGIRLHADFIITTTDALDDDYVQEVHDLYYRIPRVILETERTVIKQMDPEHVLPLFDLYEKPGVTEFMEPLYPYLEEKAYEQDYFDNIYRFYDFGMWNVFLKSDERLIGRCGLEYKTLPTVIPKKRNDAVVIDDTKSATGKSNNTESVTGEGNDKNSESDNTDNTWLELGYVIDPDLWHQGYGLETTSAVLNLARSRGHHQFFAQIAPGNEASIALAKRLGFTEVGEIPDAGENLWIIKEEAQ